VSGLVRGAGLGLLLFVATLGTASATLPPGISGAWYNPAQPGHGLSIDVLSRRRALVYWSAMDLDGQPFNLYVDARIEDQRLVGRALAPRGLRFGEWDRADLEVPEWGELRIDFAGCDDAMLSWTPDGEAGAGFPAGSMALHRLTSLAGVRCDFGRPSTPPVPVALPAVGILRVGDFPIWLLGNEHTYSAIDPEGRFWSVETWGDSGSTGLPVLPHRSFVTSPRDIPQVIVGEPVAVGGGALRLDVRRLSDSLVQYPMRSTLATGTLTVADGFVHGSATPVQPWDVSAIVFSSQYPYAAFVSDVDRTIDFAGRYGLMLSSQFLDYHARIDVDTDGSICVRLSQNEASPCEFSGRLQLAFTGAPFFDFTLTRSWPDPDERYRGRGWLQRRSYASDVVSIVFVGHGAGQRALGLVGRRR
jgi:hypothetical protein